MSYKVLLVDDEMVDLEWLKKRVPWADFGLEVTATANSGFNALRVLKEQQVDILISDIRMPIMSGLELAQKAKEVNSEIKVAFISGHEDFYYARQAIQLGASGYVCKPVKDDELFDLLIAIKGVLDKERKNSGDEGKLKDAINLLKDDMVNQWLNGGDRAVDYEVLEHYGIIQQPWRQAVAVIEVDDINRKFSDLKEEEKYEAIRKCTDIIEDYINYEQLGYYYSNDKRQIIVLVKELEASVITYILKKLIQKVEKNTPMTITIGLGPFCDNAVELPGSYKKAKEAVEYKMFKGKNRLIAYDEIQKANLLEGLKDIEDQVKPIFRAVENNSEKDINDFIEELFNGIRTLNNKRAVYNFIVHFISKVEIEFKKDEEEFKSTFSEYLRNFEYVKNLETIEDIKVWLVKQLVALASKINLKNEKKDRKIIEDIKRYVEKHIESKLTLKDVADHFSFSPNYLGYLFKEATNENFSDFLIKVRMERACQYLLDPQMKIYEICDRVGYKNILYFNRQFKDYYGTTPTDYRKRNKV